MRVLSGETDLTVKNYTPRVGSNMVKSNKLFSRKPLMIGIASILAASMTSLAKSDVSEETLLKIKSQKARASLLELARKTGTQIVLENNTGESITLKGVDGSYTIDEALKLMLNGSGLVYEFTGDDSVIVRDENSDKESSEKKEKEDDIEEMVITGSRLVSDPGKLTRQMTTITREELEASGMKRLDEFLRRLPQNVNAPTNVASGIFANGENFGRAKNVYAGSSVNLRGLGAQYTLVLIDGRRPAKGGLFGDITDISSIPVDLVERIEILYDGAASIYGADAVGGVVNIITDREFDGTSLSLGVTRTEDGGGESLDLSLGHTFQLEDATLTLNAIYQDRKPLDGAERSVRFAPLPGFSTNEDFVLYPSVPGNIGTIFNSGQVLMYVKDIDGDGKTDNQALNERLPGAEVVPVNPFFSMRIPTVPPEGYMPVYSLQLPETLTGETLSLYDVVENSGVALPGSGASEDEVNAVMRQRFALGKNLYSEGNGFSLLPKDRTINLSVNYSSQLTDRLSVNLAARFSNTDRASSTRNDSQTRTIGHGNNLNPFGSSFNLSFSDNLPQTTQEVDTKSYSLSGSFQYDLSENWDLDAGFGLSRGESSSEERNRLDGQALQFALTGQEFDPVTFMLVDNGLGFHLPFLGYPDEQSYNDGLMIDRVKSLTETESKDFDLNLRGTIAELPAGDLRTNITLSRVLTKSFSMSEQFNDQLFAYQSQEGPSDGVFFRQGLSDGTTGAGVELSAPLAETLLANANMRYEKYDGVDDNALNWSSGLNWSPLDWMTVRLNRTHSVSIPASVIRGVDTQLITTFAQQVTDDTREYTGAIIPIYVLQGGNSGLKPERNYGTALGLIFSPSDALDIELNFTESSTYDQVGKPNLALELSPSEMTPEAIANNPLLYQLQSGQFALGGLTFDETTAGFGFPSMPLIPGYYIFDNRDYNLGSSYSRGVDLAIRYRLSSDIGDWFFTYSHQYMDEFERVFANICVEDGSCTESVKAYDPTVGGTVNVPLDTPIDVVDQVDRRSGIESVTNNFSPIPRHRGMFSVSWSYRGMSASTQFSVQTPTSVLRHGTKFVDGESLTNTYRIETKPATVMDLNLGYSFDGDLIPAPEWMNTTKLTLGISNFFYIKNKISREVIDKQFEPDEFQGTSAFTPYSIDPYGRTYSLQITTTF